MAGQERGAGQAGRGIAVVTGASEGFGRELARLIAADGLDLLVVARNEERLSGLARELEAQHGIGVRVWPADLCDAGAQQALAHEVAKLPRLAVVVNNAAFSRVGPLREIPIEVVQQMVALNLGALAVLSRAALENVDFRRGGILLNVGSIGGCWPLPCDALYGATKAAIARLSAALAYEIEKDPGIDVHVQVARLGGLNSGWTDRAMGPLRPGERPDRFLEMMQNDPASAARTIWTRTRRRGRLIVSDHWLASLEARFFGVFPRLGAAIIHAYRGKERARRQRG